MGKLSKMILVLFVSTTMLGQQDKMSKGAAFSFRSISNGFGVYHANVKPSKNGEFDHSGLVYTVGASLAYKKHLFALNFALGQEVEIVFSDGESQNFQDINLLYGRNLNLIKWFKVEIYTGLGLYLHKGDLGSGIYKKEEVLGIPVNFKFMFYPAKRFSMGLNPGVNFNSINTTYTGNIVFQFKFN